MPHRCTRTTAALLALLAGVVPLVGCSDRGSDSRKVAEAARELGGVGSADAPSGASSYHAASGRIGSLQVSGETAQAVTAGLLSQSLQGEGSVAIKTAMLAERSLFSDLEAALAMGRQYESLATTASALEAFDPAPDLDRIAARVKELEAKSRAAQSERASVAEKIADLESRAESLDAQATTKRDEAAVMAGVKENGVPLESALESLKHDKLGGGAVWLHGDATPQSPTGRGSMRLVVQVTTDVVTFDITRGGMAYVFLDPFDPTEEGGRLLWQGC